MHAALYAENQDVTDEQVLADLAIPFGLERDDFVQAFRSEEAKQETWRDFATAQRAGIAGFPTLIAGLGDGAEYALVTQGYQPADRLIPPLRAGCRPTRTRSVARSRPRPDRSGPADRELRTARPHADCYPQRYPKRVKAAQQR